MKYKQLICLTLLLAVGAQANFDKQIFLFPNDIFTLNLDEEFPPEKRVVDGVLLQSAKKYTSKSPLATITSTGQIAGAKVGESCFITNQFTSSKNVELYAFACNNGAKLFEWDPSSMNFTNKQEVVTTKQQLDVMLVETTDESILVTVSAALTDKGAHLYIDQGSSNSRKIPQIDISHESWEKDQQFVDNVALRTAPVKAGDNSLSLGFVFQRGTPGVASSSYLTFFEIGGKNSGSVQVKKTESGFIDDSTKIYDLQFSPDGQAIVTYSIGGTDTVSFASCLPIYSSQTLSLKFDKCKAVKSPSLANVHSTLIDLEDENSAALIFNPSTSMISRCSYDRTVPEITSCVQTTKIQIPSDLKFSRFVFGPLGNPTAEFISATKSVTSIVYGINGDSFIQTTDRLASTQFQRREVSGVVRGSTAFLSGDTGDYRVIIRASELKDSISTINITRTSDKATYTISVVLVPTINDFSFIGEFPQFQGYTNRLAQLPIFREGFAGNNLKFTASNPNIEFVYNKQFKLNKPVAPETEIRLLSSNMGLAIDHSTNTITKLSCKGDYVMGNTYDCIPLDEVNYILQADEKVLLAQNNHFIEQKGIILITSTGKQVTFTFLGDNKTQIFSKVIKISRIIYTKDVLFKMSNGMFRFYIINKERNAVEFYSSLIRELNMMKDIPKYSITEADVGIQGNFCPQKLSASPMELPIIEVLSVCKATGKTVIYSFDESTVIGNNKVTLINTKTTDVIYEDDYKMDFCSLMESFVILDSKKQELTLQNRLQDESKVYFRLDELGMTSIDSLHCVFKNLMAVVVGKTEDNSKKVYAVISGKNRSDARNRIITSGLFDSGASVSVSNAKEEGININFFKRTSWHTFIPRKGPLAFYKSYGKERSSVLALTISTTNGKSTSKNYHLDYSEYNSSVFIKPLLDTPAGIKTIDLDRSSQISGPLLSLSVSVNKSLSVNATVFGRVFKKEKQQSDINSPLIPNPDRLRLFGDIGVGFHTSEVTTTVYLYNNYTDFNFMTDIGCVTASDTAISAAVSEELVFTAVACMLGGRISLRYLIQNYKNQQITTQGVIKESTIADHVIVTSPESNTFAVLAINDRDALATTYIIQIAQEHNVRPIHKQKTNRVGRPLLVYNGFNVTLSAGPSFKEVNYGSIFSAGNKFIVLSSTLLIQDIKATVIDLSGEILNSNMLNIPGKYVRAAIDCGASNGQCLLFNSGTTIQDAKFVLDAKNNSVSLDTVRSYNLYSDFFVTSWAFSDDLLMTRAVNSKEKELILFYKRDGSHGSDPWWGLDSSTYSLGGITDAIFAKYTSNNTDLIKISSSTSSSPSSPPRFTDFTTGNLSLTLSPGQRVSSFGQISLDFNCMGSFSCHSFWLSSLFRSSSKEASSSSSSPSPLVPIEEPDRSRLYVWASVAAASVMLTLAVSIRVCLALRERKRKLERRRKLTVGAESLDGGSSCVEESFL